MRERQKSPRLRCCSDEDHYFYKSHTFILFIPLIFRKKIPMPSAIQSTMIRASAGSGKTWQLANRFLSLMVLGVSPEKIIALTFTKKAAGEFTGRIMTRLADGAASEAKAENLANELRVVLLGSESIPALVDVDSSALPTMDMAFFQEKLNTLISVLDRLALSTLDSYFVRIVRSFSLELGLNGFDLMEDSAVMAERLRTMASLFSNRLTKEDERHNFLAAFKQATWGEEENRLSQTLETFIKEHQNRWLSAPEAEKWGGEAGLWQNGSPYVTPSSATNNHIPKLAEKIAAMIGEPRSPHKTYMKGWLAVCDLLADHAPGTPIKMNTQLRRAIPLWRAYADGGYVDNDKYEFSQPLGQAVSTMLGAWISSEIRVRMHRTRGLHSVISAYEARYQDHVRSKGRLCFSDLTLLLAGDGAMASWDEHQRSMIDFRLDARYDHWLLDEFQDTSRPQWQAIGTLIDEIMQDSEGDRSVFVVGDSKQSIYGWRGGEPRLFDDLQSHYGSRLAEWHMDASYRSAQPVLDLVNTVCDLTAPKWQEIFPQQTLDRWVYHPHTPVKDSSGNDKRGHALVLETVLDEESGKDAEAKRLVRYQCVRDLLLKVEPLAHGQTCAILVKSNNQAAGMVDYLRSELPEMLVAAESDSLVVDGPIGSAFLDLFRWLSHPSDTFAMQHVRMSPLRPIIENIVACEQEDDQWQLTWAWLTGEVARHGVAFLTDTLIAGLQAAQEFSAYGQSRLREISAAAHAFSAQGGTLDQWVGSLETCKLRESTHEQVIQVMTVHKSKGLGFDIVILPELTDSSTFDTTKDLDLLEKKGSLGSTEYLLKKPTKEICEADPDLNGILENWKAEQCYERFCNLYVALTRSTTATYCILDPVGEKWTPGRRYADMVREATAGFAIEERTLGENDYAVLFESGNWVETPLAQSQETSQPEALRLVPPAARMARKVASSAKPYHPGETLGQGRGMRFGNVVHQHFEKITWLDDLPDLDKGTAADLVRECLEIDSIKQAFTRPQVSHQLLREQAIETQIDGQWISGIIDRAVVYSENGKPTHISIIDYKTDNVTSTEQLLKEHSLQLKTYAQAMAVITAVPLENITTQILSTSLKQLVPVL